MLSGSTSEEETSSTSVKVKDNVIIRKSVDIQPKRQSRVQSKRMSIAPHKKLQVTVVNASADLLPIKLEAKARNSKQSPEVVKEVKQHNHETEKHGNDHSESSAEPSQNSSSNDKQITSSTDEVSSEKRKLRKKSLKSIGRTPSPGKVSRKNSKVSESQLRRKSIKTSPSHGKDERKNSKHSESETKLKSTKNTPSREKDIVKNSKVFESQAKDAHENSKDAKTDDKDKSSLILLKSTSVREKLSLVDFESDKKLSVPSSNSYGPEKSTDRESMFAATRRKLSSIPLSKPIYPIERRLTTGTLLPIPPPKVSLEKDETKRVPGVSSEPERAFGYTIEPPVEAHNKPNFPGSMEEDITPPTPSNSYEHHAGVKSNYSLNTPDPSLSNSGQSSPKQSVSVPYRKKELSVTLIRKPLSVPQKRPIRSENAKERRNSSITRSARPSIVNRRGSSNSKSRKRSPSASKKSNGSKKDANQQRPSSTKSENLPSPTLPPNNSETAETLTSSTSAPVKRPLSRNFSNFNSQESIPAFSDGSQTGLQTENKHSSSMTHVVENDNEPGDEQSATKAGERKPSKRVSFTNTVVAHKT